jgi:hypothetical protein
MNDWIKTWMNKMMHLMMLSCKDATFLLTKNEYQKLNLKENLQIKMHLMGCKFCRAFEKQNKIISEKIHYIQTHPLELELDHDKKKNIQGTIEEHEDNKEPPGEKK